MTSFVKISQTIPGLTPEIQLNILVSVGIILILWLLRSLILRIVWKQTEEARSRYIWRKTINYLAVVLGIILVVPVWFKDFKSSTFLGLASAGLAIALKDLITNIAGWIFIIFRQPFTIGDRIQVGVHAGDVIDIRVFQFTIMEIGNWVDADQSTGRIIHIPNGKVFSDSLANYSKGFQYIWHEIPVLITFESNWEKAKEILHKIVLQHAEHLTKSAEKKVKEASRKFMIYYAILTPYVYINVKESGVELTLRYLCEPRNRRSSSHAIWGDILKEFSKCSDIDFAYPTQRFYNNRYEGKDAINKTGSKDI